MLPKAMLEERGFWEEAVLLGTFHKGSHPPKTRHLRLPRLLRPLHPASHSHTRGSCSSAARSSMGCLHSSGRPGEGGKGPFSGFSMVPMCCSVCWGWSSPQGAPEAGDPWGRTAKQLWCPPPAWEASRGAGGSLRHVHHIQRSASHPPMFWQTRGPQNGAGPPGEARAGCTSPFPQLPQHPTGTVQRLQDLVTRS